MRSTRDARSGVPFLPRPWRGREVRRSADVIRPGGACSPARHAGFVLSVSMSTVLGPTRPQDDAPHPDTRRRGPRVRGDLVAAPLACAPVAAASLYGWAAIDRGVDILVGWPPVLADWMPHFRRGGVGA